LPRQADGIAAAAAYGVVMTALGRLRHVVRRHPHVADVAVALAVFTATALTAFTDQATATSAGRWMAVSLAAVACGALAARRQHPLAVLAVSAVATEAFLALLASPSGALILLAPLVALYTVADLSGRRRGLVLGGAAFAGLVLVHVLVLHRQLLLGPQNLAFLALGGLAIAAGDASRHRRAYLAEVELRAARTERERDQEARRQVAEERLRIARDLHDAVGHQLALISVQANVASQVVDSDGQAVREALAHVRAASRQALGDLRDTVNLLREPGDPVAPTAVPAPGLAGLDELVASLRASGLEVERDIAPAARPLPPAADVTAYRVVQEALTNVYKHSRARRASLALSFDRDSLRITVTDAGGGAAGGEAGGALPAGGNGIRGMRERVLALGGGFAAGARPDGTFQVVATLPYEPRDPGLEPVT
jgi:signal transduction histidine kinase